MTIPATAKVMITDESPEIIQVDSPETFGTIGGENFQGRNNAQSSKEKLPSKRIRIYSVSVQVIINYQLYFS